MNNENFKQETPKDQEWVSYPDFEEKLYNKNVRFPKIKSITQGPKYYWFSYYDKFQTDPSDRFVLSMQVEFDDRSPAKEDYIKIGMIDLQDNNKWIELGKTCAWCWQQGCMLQWKPNSKNEILWNDRVKDRFVCHILDVYTGKKHTLDYPVYHISPDGKKALSLDFSRVQSVRPGYGYAGLADKNENILRPDNVGISLLDLGNGNAKLLFSIADVASIKYADSNIDDDKHWFNHAAWNISGSRFLFLNRWRSLTNRFASFRTRMLTSDEKGSDLRVVTDKPYVSHFTWRDSEHIAMWREDGYKLFKDDGHGKEEKILDATNGHISYLPGNNWMISDTYIDKNDDQNLFLFHTKTKKIVPLGHFKTLGYKTGELRCDLHPRQTRDGKKLIVDSTHAGNGRQQYIIDIEDALIQDKVFLKS